ncbi:hypothetical protein AB6A40_004159 [Gnathostoma spinigerum]|uniref:Uncharacterized protein n=1 Tax=Gnathostoma spinigerum TaxID=75299 RepID=A0ABD6EBN6_9BILA
MVELHLFVCVSILLSAITSTTALDYSNIESDLPFMNEFDTRWKKGRPKGPLRFGKRGSAWSRNMDAQIPSYRLVLKKIITSNSYE